MFWGGCILYYLLFSRITWVLLLETIQVRLLPLLHAEICGASSSRVNGTGSTLKHTYKYYLFAYILDWCSLPGLHCLSSLCGHMHMPMHQLQFWSFINHERDFISPTTLGCGHRGVALQHTYTHAHTHRGKPSVLKGQGTRSSQLVMLSVCSDVSVSILCSKCRAYSGHLSHIKQAGQGVSSVVMLLSKTPMF